MNTDRLLRQILRDIEVEVLDSASMNFRDQGFFGEKWKRRVGPLRPGGATLVDTGRLRRSISSEIQGTAIVFTYGERYAPYHNEGAEVRVTARMKRFFWAKYKEATGAFGRKKDGSLRSDKRNQRLGGEAEFWKWMALKKEGSVIKIPRRRFLGSSPQLEAAVREIIEENLSEYFDGFEILKGQ